MTHEQLYKLFWIWSPRGAELWWCVVRRELTHRSHGTGAGFFFFFFFLLTSEHNDPVKCVLLENFIDQLSSPRLKES